METVIRGLVVYIVLLAILRLSGRRTLSQMTPFDIVLLLIASETTQQAMLQDDQSLTAAILLLITLFATDIGLSALKQHWRLLGKVIDGVPTALIVEGVVDRQAMKRSRVGMDDILQSARATQGLTRVEDIRFAVLETGGSISIVPKKGGGD